MLCTFVSGCEQVTEKNAYKMSVSVWERYAQVTQTANKQVKRMN